MGTIYIAGGCLWGVQHFFKSLPGIISTEAGRATEYFPDGTPIDEWFYKSETPEPERLGKSYLITEYGVKESSEPQTAALQALIDRIHEEGGGLMVVPEGTFVSGSLYFKQGVNLYISEGGVLKGSDDICDYGLGETRIEGQTCTYYHALINADRLDGFTICGPGTIDGNGLRSWKAFWQRRIWNPACTNKDEQRARLVYISNCSNVTISGLTLQNSQFWTSHLYKCDHVRYLGVKILSPKAPVKAPSTDAIDIDACKMVHVKNCYFAVNDDSVVLKGGKGPYADEAAENGSNEYILVEDCNYGFCHGCLTCGSESVHNRNILMRRIKIEDGFNLLWLKMRPDTPQLYEYITLEDIEANVSSCININPWRQFYDLGDRNEIPKSYAGHISLKNSKIRCATYLDIELNDEQYELANLSLKNLRITTADAGCDISKLENSLQENVQLNIESMGNFSEQDEEELRYRK